VASNQLLPHSLCGDDVRRGLLSVHSNRFEQQVDHLHSCLSVKRTHVLGSSWDRHPMGSLAGAAHLLKNNAGALKQSSVWTETSLCRRRPSSPVDVAIVSANPEHESVAQRSFVDGVRVLSSRSQRCQKNYHRDNWLVAAKRSQRRCFLILRCRLFLASHPQLSGRVGLFTLQQGT